MIKLTEDIERAQSKLLSLNTLISLHNDVAIALEAAQHGIGGDEEVFAVVDALAGRFRGLAGAVVKEAKAKRMFTKQTLEWLDERVDIDSEMVDQYFRRALKTRSEYEYDGMYASAHTFIRLVLAAEEQAQFLKPEQLLRKAAARRKIAESEFLEYLTRAEAARAVEQGQSSAGGWADRPGAEETQVWQAPDWVYDLHSCVNPNQVQLLQNTFPHHGGRLVLMRDGSFYALTSKGTHMDILKSILLRGWERELTQELVRQWWRQPPTAFICLFRDGVEGGGKEYWEFDLAESYTHVNQHTEGIDYFLDLMHAKRWDTTPIDGDVKSGSGGV